MIKAFGILKVVLSIAILTFAPFAVLIHLAQPPTSNSNDWLYISLLLIPYGCYLFNSGQTQLMKLELKKTVFIWAGGILGLSVSIALIYNFMTLASFLIFFLLLTISVQDLFRVKKATTNEGDRGPES